MKGIKKLVILVISIVLVMGSMSFSELKIADREKLENLGYTAMGPLEFREGLVTVILNQGNEDFHMNYINESYELVDLNKGRYDIVYPFSEGLAGVVEKETGRLGYINKKGEEVIPCLYGRIDQYGLSYAGFFKDGSAIITEDWINPFKNPFGDPLPFYVAKIDTSGKIVKDYYEVADGLTNLDLVSDVGHFVGPSFVEIEIEKITTTNQSSLSLDRWEMFDNGPAVYYTIKNEQEDTSTREFNDTSRYAILLVTSSKDATLPSEIHFLKSVDLKSGESASHYFESGMGAWNIFTGKIKASIIKFESEESLNAFKEEVPLDKFTPKGERMYNNGDYGIDSGDLGKAWLKKNFNIVN